MPHAFVCVICGRNFEREKIKGRELQPRKLCDSCREWHKWCSWGSHAPLRSQFAASKHSTDGRQTTCNVCLPDMRGNFRIRTCAACWCEFIPATNERARFNGQSIDLCAECYLSVKHCKRCDEIKPRDEFSPAREKGGGTAAHCRACQRRKWHSSTPKERFKFRTYQFGVSYEEWLQIREHQSDLCLICGAPEKDVLRGQLITLSIDHNHETGEIRGLLCGRCNKAIGLMDDDPDRLRRAAEYVQYSRYSVGT